MTQTRHGAERFLGHYGPHWGAGVLSEHAADFEAAGGVIRRAASGSGREWAIMPDRRAVPVVCSELVEISTEDGKIVGRCGQPAIDDDLCGGHAAQQADWRAADYGDWARKAWAGQSE